jgi:GcrA cell cycle regulator
MVNNKTGVESPWTAEKETKLRELWLEGLPATKIAPLLGVTRNAVIGKVNRMDLKRSDGVGWPQKTRTRVANGVTRDARLALPAEPKPMGPPEFAPEPVLPTARLYKIFPTKVDPDTVPTNLKGNRGVTIRRLRESCCKFPLGGMHERVRFYCGEPRLGTKPYCTDHCAIAYVAPQPRKRA